MVVRVAHGDSSTGILSVYPPFGLCLIVCLYLEGVLVANWILVLEVQARVFKGDIKGDVQPNFF